MNILVIGGTRFIGRAVVNTLYAMGHHVAVYHRGNTPANLPEEVVEIIGDREHLQQARTSFKKFAPDVVVDMICFNEEQARQSVHTFKDVTPRLVVVSSMDVYRAYGLIKGIEDGGLEPVPLSERSALRNRLYPYRTEKTAEHVWSYTYDKILVERIIMNSDEPVGTVLRLPAVYGPGDYRLYEFVQRMLDRRPAILLDEHFTHLKWTHAYVDHVAYAISLAVINPVAAGRIYNVGASETLSMLEIAQLIKNLMGWHGEIIPVKREHLPQDMIRIPGTIGQHLIVEDILIRKELGFVELIELQECFRCMIEWQRNHAPHDATKRVNYLQEDELLRKLSRNS